MVRTDMPCCCSHRACLCVDPSPPFSVQDELSVTRGPLLMLNITLRIPAPGVIIPPSPSPLHALMPLSSTHHFYIDLDIDGLAPLDIAGEEVKQRGFRATSYSINTTRTSYYRYEQTGE